MSAALLHCCKSFLLCGSHGTTAVAHQVCVHHFYACVNIAYACAMTRARVCRCVRVCAFVCWKPTFQLFAFLLCLLPYHVRITPSLKLPSSRLCDSHGTTAVAQKDCVDQKLSNSLLCGSHGTTAVTQQVCVDHVYAFVDIAYACVIWVLIYVNMWHMVLL